jgi:hypothetical protein
MTITPHNSHGRPFGFVSVVKSSIFCYHPVARRSALATDHVSAASFLPRSEHMMKILMTWDIRPGKESEYFEFVVQEFAPKLLRMGIQPTEAWYTVYGEGPQILAGGVAEDRASLDKALAGEDWQRLKKKLFTFVTNFSYKIVLHTGNFQL